MHNYVYLDNHATTPLDPRVLDAMLPYFGPSFGNPASRSHRFGWEAEKAVDHARRQIAALAGTQPREIVFTSGATESNNLALKGVFEANRKKGNHIITLGTEHKAVLDTLKHLELQGCSVTVLMPRRDGIIDLDELRGSIQSNSVLVTIMFANNETGVIQPVRQIGSICREKGVLFHCDAAQAFGKVPTGVEVDFIDLMSVTAHKMYGPKGVGALYIRRRPKVAITAQMDGGGHELGVRAGTLNVPAIVGFGEACAIGARELDAEAKRMRLLRDRLKDKLESELTEVLVNGSMEHRLPHNLNMSFSGVDSEALLASLPDLALSSGSACNSALLEPSHVLKAMGVRSDLAQSSIRFGIGRFNTEADVEYAAGRVIESVRKLRNLAVAHTIPV